MGSWGQDAWVSPFPRCCLTSCAVLSFYLFFFLLRSELGQVNKIKTLEGAAPRPGGSHESPSQLWGWQIGRAHV